MIRFRQGIRLAGGVLLLVAVGCGTGQKNITAHLYVAQQSWDSVQVEVQYSKKVLFGEPQRMVPETTTYFLFNTRHDTLYAGPEATLPIPDRLLGNTELLLVEACGLFERVTVCEQEAVASSPKRIRVVHDISYPEDEAFERGSYDLRFLVERQVYEEEAWERIEKPSSVQGYLLAYVGEGQGGGVKVPFSRWQGRFDLKRYDGYKDFNYYLRSKLLDDRSAPIHFDVYAGLNGQAPVRLTSVEKLLHKKTEEERRADVRHFVRQATHQILSQLDRGARDRARTYIEEWAYKEATDVYAIDLEITWTGRGVFGRRRRLIGTLEVKGDGTEALFRRRRANERADQQWRQAVRGTVLRLDELEVLDLPEAPPPRIQTAGREESTPTGR